VVLSSVVRRGRSQVRWGRPLKPGCDTVSFLTDREHMKPRYAERHHGRSGVEFLPYERGAGVTVQPTGMETGSRPTVTGDDWKRKPLPGKRATISLQQSFSAEELSLIRRGLVPQQIADQWFIFYEGNALFFHRSWTGHCIYVVHFHDTGDEISATYIDVNRDPEQYNETDDQRDRELVLELIHVLLLHGRATAGSLNQPITFR